MVKTPINAVLLFGMPGAGKGTQGKILGCIPGFVHVDALAFPHVDHVRDVTDLSCFDTDSCDLIYACHIVEHFPRHGVGNVLKEWQRVLRPGGVLRIAVPDFEAACEKPRDQRLLHGRRVPAVVVTDDDASRHAALVEQRCHAEAHGVEAHQVDLLREEPARVVLAEARGLRSGIV